MQYNLSLSTRDSWPVTNPLTVDQLNYNQAAEPLNPQTQLTGLATQGEWRFGGSNQTKSTRRPQGISVYGNYIINSWYFRNSPHEGLCKLTVMDKTTGQARNVVPVQYGVNGFESIESHAGGIAVDGNYLFIADVDMLLVFDLQEFYDVADNSSSLDPTDDFAALYQYFLPQIGEISFTPPENVEIAWVSLTEDYESFLLGNFYKPGHVDHGAGGKSWIWEFPIDPSQPHEFATPSGTVTTIEPKFEDGSPVTEIQGALLSGNKLILNRSWSDDVYQLVVTNVDGTVHFVGTDTDPTHNDKNWLYGCEDWCFDGDKVLTVTEFYNNRNVTSYLLNDVLALADSTMTIAEHEAAITPMHDEVNFYQMQIDTAKAEGLTEFDRDTYLV